MLGLLVRAQFVAQLGRTDLQLAHFDGLVGRNLLECLQLLKPDLDLEGDLGENFMHLAFIHGHRPSCGRLAQRFLASEQVGDLLAIEAEKAKKENQLLPRILQHLAVLSGPNLVNINIRCSGVA